MGRSDPKIVFLEYVHIIYRWKGNLMLTIILLRTMPSKSTEIEIWGKNVIMN